jgi:hypothetical protein
LVERWKHEYNTFRPHSALGDQLPALEGIELKTAVGVRWESVLKPGKGRVRIGYIQRKALNIYFR